MNGLPMSVKLLVADVGEFAEEKRETNVRLVVWFCVVGELLVFECVVYLFQRHRGQR